VTSIHNLPAKLQLMRRMAARAIKLAFGSQGLGKEAEEAVASAGISAQGSGGR